ncbi:VCBS repeat-containing protein [Gammaproteobacteria bacterium]|nr:VCBS repeat-containing protein [Gammaproteobacteria bacterium]
MITKRKTISALLVLIFSNSLSAQTAEFDTTSGYLTIPLLKLGADVYEQVRFQYDGNLDFNVVDFAKKSQSDAKTNATFDGSTLDLKVVKVGDAAYSNLEFAFKPPLKFSITKVQEPQLISETSLANRKSKEWLDVAAIVANKKDEYSEKYNALLMPVVLQSTFIDIDLDGDDDLFVASSWFPSTGEYTIDNYGESPGLLWLNDGAGSFVLNEGRISFDMPMFEHARRIISADFNNDFYPDIVIADHGFDASPFPGGKLSIVLSNVDGSYTAKSASGIGFHHGVSAGDFDDDGDIDLYSVAAENGGLLINDGKGNFESSKKIEGLNYKALIFNTISNDFDDDGLDDILVLGESWRTKPTILYQEKFDFSAVELPFRESYQNLLDAETADLNDDGVLDIILLATGGDENRENYYQGIGLYAVLMTANRKPGQIVDLYYSDTEQWIPSIRAQDLNDDGIIDIFSEDKHYNFLMIGKGGGNFEKQYAFVSPEFQKWDIETDINKDGYLDILTTENYRTPNTVTYGSDIEFIDRNERYLRLESVPAFTKTFKFAVGDLNSDGNSDLVATATNNSTGLNVGCAIGVYFLVGKQLNEYRTIYSDEDSSFCYEAKITDIDSDGDMDITTNINGGPRLTLINDGAGNFEVSE